MISAPFNEIGDTLAGFAGALAFVWLIVTVWVQSSELKLAHNESLRMARALEDQAASQAIQRLETSFFEMLGAFDNLVASMRGAGGKSYAREAGRQVFEVYVREFYDEYICGGVSGLCEDADVLRSIREAFEEVWGAHNLSLGHYFRFLYNMFRFLEARPGEVSEVVDRKLELAKILRAMLSNSELEILFYNMFSCRAENFRRIADKFELFDNLPDDSMPLKDHWHLWEKLEKPMLDPQ